MTGLEAMAQRIGARFAAWRLARIAAGIRAEFPDLAVTIEDGSLMIRARKLADRRERDAALRFVGRFRDGGRQ